jgi:cell division protein FtsI (penicillin-binding protein 3)
VPNTGRWGGRADRAAPTPARPAARSSRGGVAGEVPNAFTSRRAPGSRRSGVGLSMDQRGMRNRWGLIVMITLLVLVVGKLAVLQGVDGAAYANAAEQDRLRTYPIAALRGAVLDRDGNPFAYTVDASRVVADPAVVRDPERTALALTTLLDVPVPELTERLEQDSRYVVLAKQVSPEITDAIDALELPGIVFEDDPVRLYPAGAVGGQVVGFVGRDGKGLAGIEQTFEDELAGTDGKRRVEVGSGGNPIPSGIDESTPATDGDSVTLTLDQDLQFVTEQRLAEACKDGATTRASAVVLDVRTGQVAAMGSCPGYDPGNYSKTDPELLGNPLVSDVFEPGSVMKAVTLSAALEEGVAEPDRVLTVNGHIDAGDRVVTDAHDHEPVDWTVTGILAKSSNVGTIMLAREIGDEKLEHYLRAFGEGTRVISQATADKMAYMLEAVVGPGGTAPLGQIEGFRVAGKTGTAQRANPECNCYEGGGYVTTFVGFAPADDPQYVVAVDLERPTSSAEGGQVAAPVFADILRYALTADGVVPSGTARPDFVLTGPP